MGEIGQIGTTILRGKLICSIKNGTVLNHRQGIFESSF
jgi:hypothetical protein